MKKEIFDYITINTIYTYRYYLIDRNKLKILEIDTLYKTITDKTKNILKYIDKYDTTGYSILNAFIRGNHNHYDLIMQTNDKKKLPLEFNLDNYYRIKNDYKSNIIIQYDKNQNEFTILKKEV